MCLRVQRISFKCFLSKHHSVAHIHSHFAFRIATKCAMEGIKWNQYRSWILIWHPIDKHDFIDIPCITAWLFFPCSIKIKWRWISAKKSQHQPVSNCKAKFNKNTAEKSVPLVFLPCSLCFFNLFRCSYFFLFILLFLCSGVLAFRVHFFPFSHILCEKFWFSVLFAASLIR